MIKNILPSDNFSKNSFFYISSSIVGQGLSFLLIPFFTRVLTPYEYGLFAVYMSLVTLFFVFYEMNVRRAIVRYYHEKEKDFSIFLFNGIVFLIIWASVLSLVVIIFDKSIANFFNVPNRIIFYVIVGVLLSLIVEVYLSLLSAEEKARKYAMISYIRSFLIILFSIIGVLVVKENKYWGRIYGYILSLLLVSVYSLGGVVKKIKIKFYKKHIIYIFMFSIPLMFHTFSGFLLAFSDRIIINQVIGSKEAGLYSFAYNIAMIMNVFLLGFNKAWLPFFYRKMKEGKIDDIKRKSEDYSLYVSFLLLCIGLIAPYMAIFMASDKYIDGVSLIPIMSVGIGFIFVYTLYANICLYYKKTVYIAFNTFVSALVNVILNYWLIPIKGYKVAAYTTVLSYILLFLMNYVTDRYRIKETIFDLTKVLFPFILAILIIILFSLLEKIIVHFKYVFICKSIVVLLYLYVVLRIIRIKKQKGRYE